MKGRKSRKGLPLPPDEMPKPLPVVGICRCEKIDALIGART
ncbi:MAG: hypothetical protein ACHQCF_02455 [Solirubrobacterales bacterium]